MARLLTTGFEVNEASRGSNSFEPSASVLGTGAATIQALTVRSGAFAGKSDSGASTGTARWNFVYSAPTASVLFFRVYLFFSQLPDAGSSPTVFGDAAASWSARLTSGGNLQLWTAAQQGADSAASIVTGQWYRIEANLVRNSSGQWTNIELRLDGATVGNILSGLTLTQTGEAAGWVTSPGLATGSKVVYVDDIGVNDATGAAQNTWCGDGKIVLLNPVADSAVGTSWTTSGGASTGLFGNVDNEPPTGIADTTANAGHQIRNAGSASASYDATLGAYSDAIASGGGGMGASDTVNVVVPIISTAAPVVTGAKTGSVGIASNPTIANIAFVNGATAAANFWQGTTAGTYPTGWKWEKGTITSAPSVTLATKPVMRVTITGGTASRVALVDFMGLYVDYTPASAPTGHGPAHRTPAAAAMTPSPGAVYL